MSERIELHEFLKLVGHYYPHSSPWSKTYDEMTAFLLKASESKSLIEAIGKAKIDRANQVVRDDVFLKDRYGPGEKVPSRDEYERVLAGVVRHVVESRSAEDSEYDDAMPKVDPGARRIQEFMLGDNFQAEFDAWAVEVEKEHGGSLEITHEEIIHDGVKLLIFWRIVHGPHASKQRQ